jgi:hypothetical protein
MSASGEFPGIFVRLSTPLTARPRSRVEPSLKSQQPRSFRLDGTTDASRYHHRTTARQRNDYHA